MRTSLTAALCGVLASLAFAGSALAADVDGTNGGDRLRGTSAADAIQARGGNDRVRARSGNDRVKAGRGRDRVSAGAGSDRVSGGAGSDTLAGNSGDDLIDARDGSVDTVTCGAGEDVAKLDQDDVIGDATADNPNGSCETVRRTSADSGSDTGAGTREDCPEHANREESNSDSSNGDSSEPSEG